MKWREWASDPSGTLLALDFDGTLSPIVPDPNRAFIHARSAHALQQIATRLCRVAIVTGRPVAQVRRLGGFEEGQTPQGLVVFGQYGAEWWDSSSGETIEPQAMKVVRDAFAEVQALLIAHDAQDAFLEDKNIALAIHTRGLTPELAQRLLEPVREFAAVHGLRLEPGRQVLELRQEGTDKGQALRKLVERSEPRRVIYAGDDLGDVPAFDELGRLRNEGIETLGIAVVSEEQRTIAQHSDLTVEGTEGFAEWLEGFAQALGI